MIDNLQDALGVAAAKAAQFMSEGDDEMMIHGLDILLKVSQIHKNLQIENELPDPVNAEIKKKTTRELVDIAKRRSTGKV